jgi:cation diffusion facilitator CzcD-associated flavoprotein CzcO
MSSEFNIDTVVIGGGQAGLAAGYFLHQHKKGFVI